MNYLLNTPVLITDEISNCDSDLAPSFNQFQQSSYRIISQQQRLLTQLIQQHQTQLGWIVLLAPSPQIIKRLANIYELPLHKVLVIHKKQLLHLNTVIHTALKSGNCKVVINCSQVLTDNEDHFCQKLAAQHNAWFYQLDSLCQKLQTH